MSTRQTRSSVSFTRGDQAMSVLRDLVDRMAARGIAVPRLLDLPGTSDSLLWLRIADAIYDGTEEAGMHPPCGLARTHTQHRANFAYLLQRLAANMHSRVPRTLTADALCVSNADAVVALTGILDGAWHARESGANVARKSLVQDDEEEDDEVDDQVFPLSSVPYTAKVVHVSESSLLPPAPPPVTASRSRRVSTAFKKSAAPGTSSTQSRSAPMPEEIGAIVPVKATTAMRQAAASARRQSMLPTTLKPVVEVQTAAHRRTSMLPAATSKRVPNTASTSATSATRRMSMRLQQPSMAIKVAASPARKIAAKPTISATASTPKRRAINRRMSSIPSLGSSALSKQSTVDGPAIRSKPARLPPARRIQTLDAVIESKPIITEEGDDADLLADLDAIDADANATALAALSAINYSNQPHDQLLNDDSSSLDGLDDLDADASLVFNQALEVLKNVGKRRQTMALGSSTASVPLYVPDEQEEDASELDDILLALQSPGSARKRRGNGSVKHVDAENRTRIRLDEAKPGSYNRRQSVAVSTGWRHTLRG